MKKGAIFHKCDFQVHTPRDINFDGQNCVSDEDRKEYGSRFIKDCRLKGIHAVAITDHHDLAFVNYVKDASEREVDASNNPIPVEDRIIVFPGMELTLEVPCQVLLIFDSNLTMTDDLVRKIEGALGISQNPKSESKNKQPEKLQDTADFNNLGRKLNRIDELKGRFIVFPNVCDGGSSSILRNGFHQKYKDGDFVGGYLDIDKYDSHKNLVGWNNIINGKVEAYGKKEIGVFQTSDSRRNDFRDLGKCTTWVKWAEPTAEGLRQACLAKRSRISQDYPRLPGIYIDYVKVRNSSFLGNVEVYFNPQLNTLIGGRGTGKSSLLQYINYALGKDEKIDNGFIGSTFEGGEVELRLVKNNADHLIVRNGREHKIKIGNQDFTPTNSVSIRSIIQTESFKQKELSKQGGDRGKQLIELLKYSINAAIQAKGEELDKNADQIKRKYFELETKKRNEEITLNLRNERASVVEQQQQLASKLVAIPEGDRLIIEANENVGSERNRVDEWRKTYLDVFEKLREVRATFEGFPLPLDFTPVNQKEIEAIFAFHQTEASLLKSKLDEIIAYEKEGKLSDLEAVEQTKLNEYAARYDEAIERQQEHQVTLSLHESNVKRLQEIDPEMRRWESELQKSKNVGKEFLALFQERFKLSEDIYQLLHNESKQISSTGEGNIEIEIMYNGDMNSIVSQLNESVSGARGQSTRVQMLFDSIIQSGKDAYRKLCKFWFILYSSKNDAAYDWKSSLIRAHIDANILLDTDVERILISLTNEKIIDLALMCPDHSVKAYYYKDSTTKIPFIEASDGQQAGAILNILLKQEMGPLLIDQPEDDLDNMVITHITELIIEAKGNRQIIFASHNANIVVNADSELVLCFEYKADTKTGELIARGAIDNQIVNDAIKNIMEGGEKAFELRKEKYGF